MKFTIAFEPTYLVITPTLELFDNEAAEALCASVQEHLDAKANLNFIIDLKFIQQLQNDAVHPLLRLQTLIDASESLVVYTNVQEVVLQKIKQERLHLSLQVANDMEEALALVNQKEKLTPGLLNEM